MRFKVDENLPAEIVDLLRGEDYDAMSILQQQMGGREDDWIAEVVRQEHRALITLDLDFADIRKYPPEDYHGIVVLRLATQDKRTLVSVFRRLLPLLKSEPLTGTLWIADEPH
jgi:predicted nuclease of predicted toxin-antitoxin system